MSIAGARWAKWGGLAVALVLVAGFVVGTLARSANDSAGAEDGGHGGAMTDMPSSTYSSGVKARERSALPAQSGADAAGSGAGALSPLGERIARSADISVEVAGGSFDAAFRRASAVAARFGGQVMAATRTSGGKDDDALSGDVVLRVPADRFEAATDAIRDIGKVLSDSSTSQDVTEEYVDLTSRLRALRAEERVLLRLMAQAKTIADTLQIQERLSSIQSDVEQITGRIRYLEARTDYSSISVHLAEPGASAHPERRPTFGGAWETALDGLVRMATAAVIGVVWLLPFALFALVILGMRRARKPSAPQATP